MGSHGVTCPLTQVNAPHLTSANWIVNQLLNLYLEINDIVNPVHSRLCNQTSTTDWFVSLYASQCITTEDVIFGSVIWACTCMYKLQVTCSWPVSVAARVWMHTALLDRIHQFRKRRYSTAELPRRLLYSGFWRKRWTDWCSVLTRWNRPWHQRAGE